MCVLDGKFLTTGEIDAQLQQVLVLAETANAPHVGVLTSDNRDKWTDLQVDRQHRDESGYTLQIVVDQLSRFKCTSTSSSHLFST